MLLSNSTKAGVAAVMTAAAIGFASTPTQASITYVDANDASDVTGTNTTLLSGVAFTPTNVGNDSHTDDDDFWSERTAAGNGGQVYTSNDSGGGEDAPMLKTTISGLAAGGSYNVYGYFRSNSQNWALKATADKSDINDPDNTFGSGDESLPDDSSVFFSANGSILSSSSVAPQADANDFSNSVDTGGNYPLYQASLGQAVADGNGDLPVYVDNYVTAYGSQRTWYDGVGYEAVPEPASLALLGIGGVLLASNRRRRDRAT